MYVTLETIEFKHLILLALPNSFVSSSFHFVSCIISAVMQYPIAVIIHKVSNVDHLLSQGCQLRPHISGSSIHCDFKNQATAVFARFMDWVQ